MANTFIQIYGNANTANPVFCTRGQKQLLTGARENSTGKFLRKTRLAESIFGKFEGSRPAALLETDLVTGASSRFYGVFRFKRFFAIVWAFTLQGAISKILIFSTVISLSRFFSIFKIFRAYKKSYSSASNILLRCFCFSSALFLLSLKDRIA